MAKLVLFSNPTEAVMQKIEGHIFPENAENKTITFMPAEGLNNMKEKYKVFWEGASKNKGFEIKYIDLESSDIESAKDLLEETNILIVTGGNTFILMNYLRTTGLDVSIKKFIERSNSTYVGFSAGAIILTPTINIASAENTIGLKDLSGLNVLDFEILPHFDAETGIDYLESYKTTTEYEVKTITDDEALIIENSNIIKV